MNNLPSIRHGTNLNRFELGSVVVVVVVVTQICLHNGVLRGKYQKVRVVRSSILLKFGKLCGKFGHIEVLLNSKFGFAKSSVSVRNSNVCIGFVPSLLQERPSGILNEPNKDLSRHFDAPCTIKRWILWGIFQGFPRETPRKSF